MLKIRVIPCLDVKDGRVVKGVQFGGLIDAGDPVALAERYDHEGADELCFLDINASHEGRGVTLDLVARTAERCFIPLLVGGGVRGNDDVRALLLAGADKVSFNTAAVHDPECIKRGAEKFGSQCIVAALDVKRKPEGGFEIFTHGGRRPTGLDAIAWAARMEELGAGELLVTSMDRDGVQTGCDVELLKAITARVRVPVIASGGVGALEHFAPPAQDGGATAVLAASVFHFGKITIGAAKEAMRAAGLPVRSVPVSAAA